MVQTRILAFGTCWNLLGTYSLRGANPICSFWEPIGTCPEPTYFERGVTPNDYFLWSPVLQYILLNQSTGGPQDSPNEPKKELGPHPDTF